MSKKSAFKIFSSQKILFFLAVLWVAIFVSLPQYCGIFSDSKLTVAERAYLAGLRKKYSGTQRTLTALEASQVISSACSFISARKSLENTYDTPAVRSLLFGTACTETGLRPRYQDSAGNAIGLFQIEYATFCDIWQRFVKKNHPELGRDIIKNYACTMPDNITFEDLQLSDELCAIFARLKYSQIKEPIPPESDIPAQAAYYKAHYNTRFGKASPQGYIKAYNKFAPALVQSKKPERFEIPTAKRDPAL